MSSSYNLIENYLKNYEFLYSQNKSQYCVQTLDKSVVFLTLSAFENFLESF